MDPLTRALLGGAAGSSSAEKLYIESVFSVDLYTGNGSTQTITNGIDLAGKGGLVWIKGRSDFGGSSAWGGNIDHMLVDTARGMDRNSYSNVLVSNMTGAQSNFGTGGVGALASGFEVGYNGFDDCNYPYNAYASWTFRKAAKFFDVVTYTGNEGYDRVLTHNLGSTPGCIIVKCTNTASTSWMVWHRTFGPNDLGLLENSSGITGNSLNTTVDAFKRITNVGSTTFTVNGGASDSSQYGLNRSGRTYVAYLFAHDAGGFGDSGNESVVKCGSYTTDASRNAIIDLGWEPQWVLYKASSTTGRWDIADNMRGLLATASGPVLSANASTAESSSGLEVRLTSTGFISDNTQAQASTTYIYIAIRRGPMKTPTDATKVFAADAGTNGTSGGIVTTGFPVDMDMTAYRSLGGVANVEDRVRGYGNTNTAGATRGLLTSSIAAETTGLNPYFYNAWNTTITRGSNGANPGGDGIISWLFRRAPGFFDVVAYTGTASTDQQVTHNLTVAPELIIVKHRATTAVWLVYSSTLGRNKYLSLNTSNAANTYSNSWGTTDPTATTFNINTTDLYATGSTIAYLFASCPGVSKCFSFTGNGTSQTINCGFASGARFVLLKRTDSTGNWLVADTARGIVSANDPLLYLNSTAAEITTLDWIDPDSTGFIVNQEATANANVNGATYVGLAIS